MGDRKEFCKDYRVLDLTLLANSQINLLSFMYIDRRHKIPPSETKDFIFTEKAIVTATALLCQFPEPKFLVALKVCLDKCLHTLQWAWEMAALWQSVRTPIFCSRARYYLTSQGCHHISALHSWHSQQDG